MKSLLVQVRADRFQKVEVETCELKENYNDTKESHEYIENSHPLESGCPDHVQ